MKVSITGSRGFNDYLVFCKHINNFKKDNSIKFIISGGAKGVDSLASKYSLENYIGLKEILPNWNKYGKRAGILRNIEIIENSDFNIIFWDGESKGTKFNIDYCTKNNKDYIVIDV